MQLSGEVLNRGALTCEQVLEDGLCLFRESLVCELLRQFRLKLRRHDPEQIAVICDERKVQIRLVEYQRVLVGIELYRTVKVGLVQRSVCWRSLQLHPLGTERPSEPATHHGHHPRKAHVHQERRRFEPAPKPLPLPETESLMKLLCALDLLPATAPQSLTAAKLSQLLLYLRETPLFARIYGAEEVLAMQ